MSSSTTDDEDATNHDPEDLTYGEIGLHAYGTLGKTMVDIAVIVSQIGMAIFIFPQLFTDFLVPRKSVKNLLTWCIQEDHLFF